MSLNQEQQLAPLATPLPATPVELPFTEAQWTTLTAILDTVIPSIQREKKATDKLYELTIPDEQYNTTVQHLKERVLDAPEGQVLDDYLAERFSDNPKALAALKRTFTYYVKPDARKGLGVVLSTLNTRVGSLMLTGYAKPIHEQPIHIRQSILEGWRVSYLPPLNAVYKSVTSLGKNLWLKTSPTIHKAIGFSPVPKDYNPGRHYEYGFMQFQTGPEPEIIETDVVIVGSGCGGAVCAKNLAEAGNRVLVVEKAYYYPPSYFPMSEEEGGYHLYDNGGVDVTDDGSVTFVSGSTWGGGGVVNWSASLQLQGFVRKEWAQDRGLNFFETAEFQNCLDRVCNRMGVSADHIRHNHGNLVLMEGARKLGYSAEPVPQNTAGAEHYCGSCALGCSSCGKQGPTLTWLPDAGRAGAQFVEGFKVDRVIFDELLGSKKAVGVKGVWTSRDSNGGVNGPASERTKREVVVKAKKVIISCGSIRSPIVLLNSGLKNPQIGRNLHLHPVNFVTAVFKEDVRPWEGGILTSVCKSFENLDGHGHGVKLETTCMLPSLSSSLQNWTNGLDYKTQILKARHTNLFISLARDRDTGRVYPDPTTGEPRVQYTPSAFDRAHILEGVSALAKLCYVSGAIEIHAVIGGMKPFIRKYEDIVASKEGEEADPGITDPRFKVWLDELRAIGNKPPTGTFSCAHQMGSNRMSARPRDGVVDSKGRVWGVEDLYVSDASIFPSASGVNPMVTNMAISDWISRGIARELRSAAPQANL